MKRISIILILALLTIFLNGCWDYSEIEDIAVASVMAIDMDMDTREYILNVEITDIEGTNEGINLIPVVVESRGKTLIDAARNMISVTAKTPYCSHTNTIIIGEELAKDGISSVLDWIGRNPEVGLSVNIFISKDKTAKEILFDKQELTRIRTFEHEKLQTSYQLLSKLPIIRASRVINQVQQRELFTVLPTVELVVNNGKTVSNSIGAAHFKQGNLVGYLTPEDTMKYLFVRNEIKGGILVVPVSEHEKVSLDIYKNNTSIKFKFKDESLYIYVNTKTVVDIAEIDSEFDYTTEEGLKILKKKSEACLEKELKTFIKDMQKNIGNDIFAFGNKIKKRYPNTWKSIESDWDSIFTEVDIIVNCDVRIKGSRNITTPIRVR